MRAVNLLPRDDPRSKRQSLSLPVIAAVAAPIVIGGLVFAGYTVEHGSLSSKQNRLDTVRAQIAALPNLGVPKPRPADAFALDENARRSALDSALADRENWDRTLVDLARVLPDDVWVTALGLTSPTTADLTTPSTTVNPAGFTLSGITASEDSVARLLTRLQLLPMISNVTLQTTSASGSTTSTSASKGLLTFTVNGVVAAPTDEAAT